MRKIKTRFWHEPSGQFLTAEASEHDMLWIGITDKNGVEVYEGDIVEAWSEGLKGTFEVRWRGEGVPMYILWPAYQHGQFWHPFGPQDTALEVIGNIIETPHLRPQVEGV